MADENQQKRVKVTGAAAHRKGTLRAAVKPHKRVKEPDVKEIIDEFVGSLRQGSVQQSFWGTTMTRNAAVLRNNFGLAADDEPYFLLDCSNNTGRAGLLLSKAGVHLADGKGGQVHDTWQEFKTMSVSITRGVLMIGKHGLTANDSQVALALLQKIQAAL